MSYPQETWDTDPIGTFYRGLSSGLVRLKISSTECVKLGHNGYFHVHTFQTRLLLEKIQISHLSRREFDRFKAEYPDLVPEKINCGVCGR